MPNKDFGAFISGEFGHYWFGRTNSFYGNTVFPGQADGIQLPEYNTWNVGLSFTYKVFTLDLRYVDTDLSKINCDVLTAIKGHPSAPATSRPSIQAALARTGADRPSSPSSPST